MKSLCVQIIDLWCVQTANLLDELELLEKQLDNITEYTDFTDNNLFLAVSCEA
jgi:hypothetical protein